MEDYQKLIVWALSIISLSIIILFGMSIYTIRSYHESDLDVLTLSKEYTDVQIKQSEFRTQIELSKHVEVINATSHTASLLTKIVCILYVDSQAECKKQLALPE